MLKKLLPLALGFCLSASPALAVGITQIAGTGTNGAIVSTTFAASASQNLTTTHDLPANSLIIAIAAGNAVGVSQDFGCSDSVNGTYNAGHAVTTLSGASVKILYVYSNADLANGSTITCTVTGANEQSVTIVGFSGASSTPYDSASAFASGSGTGTLTVGPTGTLNGPCGSANCEVLIGAVETRAQDGNTTIDASFTSVTATTTSSPWMFGFKIVSASTAVSYAPSTTSSSSNWVGQLEGFMAAAAGGSTKPAGLTLMGAGP